MLLALPGQTVTTAYLNDLFIFLDGAHRIASGQVPNRDFHTALGPLSFYVPALGYWISGSMGGAMPAAMAAMTVGLALPMIHILGSRLRPVVAIPYGLFLLLIVAVPTNLGESIASLSFAMFYNRIGWAALSLLLVMYLRPEKPHGRQNLLDALCAALLALMMLYTKVDLRSGCPGFSRLHAIRHPPAPLGLVGFRPDRPLCCFSSRPSGNPRCPILRISHSQVG